MVFEAAGRKAVEAAVADFLKILGGDNNGDEPGPIDGGFRWAPSRVYIKHPFGCGDCKNVLQNAKS